MDLGLCLADFDDMTIGMIIDLLVERVNESNKPKKNYASQSDIDSF